MADALDNYIQELNFFADNMQETVTAIGVKNGRGIVKMQNDRLLNHGLDANENLIGGGVYSSVTINHKSNRGDTISHVTLKDTGDWHGNMFVSGTKELLIDNSDSSLTGELMNGGGQGSNPPYGKDIIGLTDEEEVFLAQNVIDPELQKEINKLTTFIEL